MSALSSMQLRALRVLAAGKVLVSHRTGFATPDGSLFLKGATVAPLIDGGLIGRRVSGGPYAITEAGRAALVASETPS